MRYTDRVDSETLQRLCLEASRYLCRPEDHPEVQALAADWLEMARRYIRIRNWAE